MAYKFNPKLFIPGKQKHIDLSAKLLKSVLVLGAVIEARDAYTGGHTWRVGQYSRLLAEQAGLAPSEIFLASLGGFVHDIGKIGIPDRILAKPERLTNDEFALIKTHPLVGATLLADHPLGPLVLDAITHHHERFDGQGYPGKLTEERLSIYPRIIAVADTFDAMTSIRSYSKGMPKEEALAQLSAASGHHLDGTLVSDFLALAAKGSLDCILGHSDESRPLVNCPMDGPILALPRNKKDGDVVHCHACKGLYRLHIVTGSFELEPLMQKRFDLQPEADLEQIDELARRAPRRVKVASSESYSVRSYIG
ncbi:MAG: HD-GYP domain-containing protein [Desulfuromusa sp.]|nr:HD-GYP domain-containing protein [Desulfuromusa sp.]